MMKLLSRRTNSFGAADGVSKSPATLFWAVLHWLCCLISLLLGFRFSRLVLFLLLSPASTNPTTLATFDPPAPAANNTLSRVVVGRHGIRIRPWPHPDPEEVIRAHRILDRVQREQRIQYGVKQPRKVIVVTPTYIRTLQTPHLTGVMHSLMSCPFEVVWIVVEAGGKTKETAILLEKSGIQTIHIGFNRKMPGTWADRQRMENRMRLLALRTVRDKKLDGIVMFADDSNIHSMELFDEAQRVKGIGAISVGILMHSGGADQHSDDPGSVRVQVQGPSCDGSGGLVGLHSFDGSPYAGRSAVYVGDEGPVVPMGLQWAGFVLNSVLLWEEDEDNKPEWMKDLGSLNGDEVENPLSLVKDPSVVEPLGSCGQKVLVWWLRVEARSGSKFPPRWIIDTPEFPSLPKVTAAFEEHAEKPPPRTRISRSKRSRSRKNREAIMEDAQVSSRQSEDD